MTELKDELNAIMSEAAQRSGYSSSDDLMALMILEVRKLRLVIEKQHQPRTTPPSLSLDNQILSHQRVHEVKTNGAAFGGAMACGSAQTALQNEDGRLRLRYPADRKIAVIRAIATAMGVGLKEAKDISEGAFYETDRHMVESLNREFANEQLGAHAELQAM